MVEIKLDACYLIIRFSRLLAWILQRGSYTHTHTHIYYRGKAAKVSQRNANAFNEQTQKFPGGQQKFCKQMQSFFEERKRFLANAKVLKGNVLQVNSTFPELNA